MRELIIGILDLVPYAIILLLIWLVIYGMLEMHFLKKERRGKNS